MVPSFVILSCRARLSLRPSTAGRVTGPRKPAASKDQVITFYSVLQLTRDVGNTFFYREVVLLTAGNVKKIWFWVARHAKVDMTNSC